MPVLLFRLKHVPDDEAEAVRGLLAEHGIDFYETSGGNWGVSVAGIWLREGSRLEEARGLIETYQAGRAVEAREAYLTAKREGRAETILDRLRSDPIGFIFYLLAILLVAFLTLAPFLGLV